MSNYATTKELETLGQLRARAKGATEEWRGIRVEERRVWLVCVYRDRPLDEKYAALYKYKDLRPAEQHFQRKMWTAKAALKEHREAMKKTAAARKEKAALVNERKASRK